jgi:hypothetical protein
VGLQRAWLEIRDGGKRWRKEMDERWMKEMEERDGGKSWRG